MAPHKTKRRRRNGPIWDRVKRMGHKTVVHRLRKLGRPVRFKGHVIRDTDAGWVVDGIGAGVGFPTVGEARKFAADWEKSEKELQKVRKRLGLVREGNPAAFDRCMQTLAAAGTVDSPRAVCTSAHAGGVGLRSNPGFFYTTNRFLAESNTPYFSARSTKLMFARNEGEARVKAQRLANQTGKSIHVYWGGNTAAEAESEDGGQFIFTAKPATKRNPEAAAAELFETFHGTPATHVEEVVEEVHEHDWLTPLGDLTCLRIVTESGYKAEIAFKRTGSSRVTLSSSEDGTSMYFVGGDQSVDLDALHMGGDKWRKDLMVLGRLREFEYYTAKGFDKFVPTIYWHKSREGLTKDGARHTIVADKDAVVLYDTRSKLLQLAGGQYKVEDVGVVG